MLTRAAGLVVVAAGLLAFGGCRSDAELAPPDLSSPALYCPPDPPLATPFVCDPTAIPYCTYPTQQLTCTCARGGDGRYVLGCAPEFPDGGGNVD